MENRLLQERIAAALLPLEGSRDAEAVARAVYDTVKKFAWEIGMDEGETAFREPGEDRHFPGTRGWTVVFEAGPFDWAIETSFLVIERCRVSCEPYYGFDLTFEAL